MERAGKLPDATKARFDPEAIDSKAVGRAASFLKTLAHEGRLEVLCQLTEGERAVSEIEAALGMPQSRVSQILMRLRSEGIVEARRDGRNVYYSMTRPEVVDVISVLRRRFCVS